MTYKSTDDRNYPSPNSGNNLIGKMALVKATIAELLKNYPNKTLFISTCKKDNYFKSKTNELNIDDIRKNVKTAFKIYEHRVENLNKKEPKSLPKFILVLDLEKNKIVKFDKGN